MAGSLPNSRRRVSEGQIRVGDAEREGALAALREHYAYGRLDAAELEERITAALIARTRSDLARLFFDLPGERRAWPPPPRRSSYRPLRLAGRVLGAATVSALLVGMIVAFLVTVLFVTAVTFGGLLWIIVFWWLLARGFGHGCRSRSRTRRAQVHWPPPYRVTRV
jgi:Domain of unknown function (DUF1707)